MRPENIVIYHPHKSVEDICQGCWQHSTTLLGREKSKKEIAKKQKREEDREQTDVS